MNAHLPLERLGFAALVILTLAVPVAVGVGVPLGQATDATLDAPGLVLGALIVGLAAVLGTVASHGRVGARFLPPLCAGIAAPVLGLTAGGEGSELAVTVALLAVAALTSLLSPWLVARLPLELDGLAAQRRGGTLAMLLLAAATLMANARIGTFMADSERGDLSIDPTVPFLVHHSCLTAYVEAARLAGEGEANLYDVEAWPDLSGSARSLAAAEAYAPFHLDAYAYPPPFLLLPRLLLTPLQDFASQRAVWFLFNALALALGLWLLPGWIGGPEGRRTLLLAPTIWTGSILFILQVGNAHGLVMMAAMLAMVAFESRRPALGGALLAFAAVTKISPGLLVILLLARGRWREMAWTALFGVLYLGAGVAALGPGPLEAFLRYELPTLSSGEALRFLTGPDSAPINLAPFGVPFKLELLGVALTDPWKLASRLASAYTLVAVGLTALAGWRSRQTMDRGPGARRGLAEQWAGVLTLAALRSPLAPPYILLTVYWLMSLRANDARGWRGTAFAAVFWVLAVFPPLTSPTGVVFGLVQQHALIVIAAWYMLRRPPEDRIETPPTSLLSPTGS